MLSLLWLFILGVITYFLLQRSARPITRTPLWLLWLVMMSPAFIWSIWIFIFKNNNIPLPVLIIPFLICPILYWWLVYIGRSRPPVSETASSSPEETKTPLRPIEPSEEESLRNCFSWSIFALHNVEYRPQAVICRGQLRTDTETAYQTIEANVKRNFGTRFLVLFQTSSSGQPFFALVPNPYLKTSENAINKPPLYRPALALSLLVITLFTTTLIGAEIAGVTDKALQANPALFIYGLPYSLGLILILGVHEFGHYFTAHFYKIPTTLPYFIPFPFFLGTFGAFISMATPAPNRKALFDVSIVGPIAGFMVTLPFLIWGFMHSEIVPITAKSNLLNFNSFNPHFSLFMTLLSKIIFGSSLNAQTALNLHPVAIAGYLGVIITAYNLMPVGQLDGGHIVHAMFGQQKSMIIGQITRFFMLVLSFLEPGLLLWAIFLFLMPIYDEPALNDVSELDNKREILGFIALIFLLIIILPAPKILI